MTLIASRRAAAIVPSMIRTLRDGARPSSLDLGLGQTDLPVSAPALDALRAHLAAPEVFAPYCPNAGDAACREAVAARYGCDIEQVLITCGVQQALALAILGMVNPGQEVLVPDPGFPAYANLVRMAGGEPVPYALDAQAHWRLDPQRVQDALSPRTAAIILCSPSNPTGAVHDPDDLAQTLALCAARGVAWISDEIYEDYVYDGLTHVSPASLADHREGGVRLGGLSKNHHMMGWRLGWMTGPASLLAQLKPLHQHLVTSAPTLSQRAGVAALAAHDALMPATLKRFEARRDLAQSLCEALPGVRCWPGQGAFYLLLDVRSFMTRFESSLVMARSILKEIDVITIPGEGFGLAGRGHLRVAYALEEDTLREALGRLDAFLKAHA